jgi:hypothetical protein
MIASLFSRRQDRTPERDVIGEILFWKLEWFEAHPLICFAGIVLTIVLDGVLERLP